MGRGKREKWLDAIKGIACIIVFLDHFYLTFFVKSNMINKILNVKAISILINGNLAVCLFLMISAYVISVPIYHHVNLEHIQKTVFKRYVRLMLPVFFASVFSLTIWHTMGYYNGQVADLMENSWLKGFFSQELTISNLFYSSLIGVWWKGDSLFNGPFWMLRTLFLGTYLAIILAILTSGNKIRKWSGSILVIVLFVYLEVNVYDSCLVLGIILAYLSCRTNFFEKWKQNRNCIVISVFLFAVAWMLPAYQTELVAFFQELKGVPVYFSNRTFYNAIGSFLLLFSFMGLEKIKDFLGNNKLLGWISKISFSVYLLHWPIICSVSCWLYMQFGANPTRAEKIALFAITTLIVMIVAAAFHKLVEEQVCGKMVNKVCGLYFRD